MSRSHRYSLVLLAPLALLSLVSRTLAEKPRTGVVAFEPDSPSMESVRAKAKKAGRPVFVFLVTRECPECTDLEEKTLADAAVAGTLNGAFVSVRYDGSKG